MMHRHVCALAVLVGLVLCISSSEAHDGHATTEKKLFTKHFNHSIFDISSHTHFSVEVLLDDSEYPIGKDRIGVAIHNDMDMDVAGATLDIVLKDKEKGVITVDRRDIDDKANGLYVVSGIDLQKDRQSELVITIGFNGIVDDVRFLFPSVMEAINPKGKYSP